MPMGGSKTNEMEAVAKKQEGLADTVSEWGKSEYAAGTKAYDWADEIMKIPVANWTKVASGDTAAVNRYIAGQLPTLAASKDSAVKQAMLNLPKGGAQLAFGMSADRDYRNTIAGLGWQAQMEANQNLAGAAGTEYQVGGARTGAGFGGMSQAGEGYSTSFKEQQAIAKAKADRAAGWLKTGVAIAGLAAAPFTGGASLGLTTAAMGGGGGGNSGSGIGNWTWSNPWGGDKGGFGSATTPDFRAGSPSDTTVWKY